MKPEVVVPFSFCAGTAWIFQKKQGGVHSERGKQGHSDD